MFSLIFIFLMILFNMPHQHKGLHKFLNSSQLPQRLSQLLQLVTHRPLNQRLQLPHIQQLPNQPLVQLLPIQHLNQQPLTHPLDNLQRLNQWVISLLHPSLILANRLHQKNQRKLQKRGLFHPGRPTPRLADVTAHLPSMRTPSVAITQMTMETTTTTVNSVMITMMMKTVSVTSGLTLGITTTRSMINLIMTMSTGTFTTRSSTSA